MHYRRMDPQPPAPAGPLRTWWHVEREYERPYDMPHAEAIYIDGDWYWRTETARGDI